MAEARVESSGAISASALGCRHGSVVFESLDVEIPLDAFFAKVEGLEPESGNQALS